MADRLSPLDVSYLYLEEDTTPMHVGGVVLFRAPDEGFDYARLVSLIRERISLVPRYRQKVRWIPGRIANPVWVDDADFDFDYHVRMSSLPRPGGDRELRELVARVMSRPLDRDRPLWELYVVEGLSDQRFAVLTKTHHAMVDGAAAIDIGQVLLDLTPEPREVVPDDWEPTPEPSAAELVAEAIGDLVRSPAVAVDALRSEATDLRSIADRLAAGALGLLTAARTVARPPSDTSLNAHIGEGRRFAMASMALDDLKRIRKAHGGTVNDVVLAVVAGGLRSWLMTRGDPVTAQTVVKALVPVSVRQDVDSGGNPIAAF
ncbi:MAG TPA: wax ester/triacylglycerol synthase family O-acyltransferase, partial [Candidatus Nanopelagicales bacterium]|nr:wax ester/triacylglycerol synthase family O-acyltransferase [Candidatus Nanopelagicales bacterium]